MEPGDFLRARLSQLRISKRVSARDMSLSLGQSESYINKIENGKALPSMEVFFYICDYFGMTPQDFFSTEMGSMVNIRELIQQMALLNEEAISALRIIINEMTKR